MSDEQNSDTGIRFSNFERKILWVDDRYRTHPWSRSPGGAHLVVGYLDGKVLGYDKVKKSSKYIEVICKEDKKVIFDDSIIIWEHCLSEYEKYMKDHVKALYAAHKGSTTLDLIYENGGDAVEALIDLEQYDVKS